MTYGGGDIERTTFTIGWSDATTASAGDRISYFTSPKIRAAVTMEVRWRYERFELQTASARPPRGSQWLPDLYKLNGSLESCAYIERVAQQSIRPFFLVGEMQDKMQIADVSFIERMRAAEMLESEYPGIAHYQKFSPHATKELTLEERQWTIEEVGRPPTHDELMEAYSEDRRKQNKEILKAHGGQGMSHREKVEMFAQLGERKRGF